MKNLKKKKPTFSELYTKIQNGWKTDDKELLKISDAYGITIAHEQTKYGWRTEDKEILKLAAKNGWTVAHWQAYRGWTTEDKEILMLVDKKGWTVAHEQARNGWVTEDKEILKLANSVGWTVAHEQAKHGWITEDEEILNLTDKYGLTVYDVIIQYWNMQSISEDKIFPLYNFILKAKELNFNVEKTKLYQKVNEILMKMKLRKEVQLQIYKKIQHKNFIIKKKKKYENNSSN